MKKILLILLCIIFPIASKAQDVFESPQQSYPSLRTYRNYVKPGVHPYLRTGVSCNDYTSVQVRGIKSVWGFAAEAGVDFFFTDTYFGFKPALRYITKGANVSWAQGDPANTKIYQQTLELPLDVTMNFRFGDDVIFQVGMGPYFAYGIGGTTYYSNLTYATFGGMGTMEIRKFDIGCGLVCSAVYRHFTATMGAEAGFVPIRSGYAGQDDRGKNVRWPRNRSFYLMLGYEF